MKSKLTVFEAIALIAVITISQIILDFPEYLISNTGTGTIPNLIFLAIITWGFCHIISNIFKNFANQDIIDISEYIGGKTLKIFISFIFIIFLLVVSASSASNYIYLIKNIYLGNNDFLFVFLLFTISIFIACIKGFESIKKTSAFFFGLLLASIIFLPFGDNGNFNTNNFMPIFGYNYKTTFLTGIKNIFIFNFITLYFFLMPLISRKNTYKKIINISFILNFLLILITIIAILQYYPADITLNIKNLHSTNIIIAVTRRISITSFLSQTDSIFFLFWTYAILCYISFMLNAIFYILNKSFKYENKQYLSFSIIPIFIGITLLINNRKKLYYLENIFFKNFSIILTFGISFLIIILGYLKKRKDIKCKK